MRLAEKSLGGAWISQPARIRSFEYK
jgi:hypothetical protein